MTDRAARHAWARSKAPSFLAGAVALAGLINILEAVFVKQPDVLQWMEQFLPFSVSQRSRLLILGAGIFQFLLSRGIYRRKRAAFLISLGLLLGLPLLHLTSAFDWHHALVQIALAAALIHWRDEFRALSDGPSVRMAVWICVLLLTLLTIFGLVSIHSFAAQIAGERTFLRDVQTVWELVFLQSTDTLAPVGRQAEIVFRTISEAGLLFGLAALLLLLRPILPRRSGYQRDESIARALIDKWGADPLDEFALLSDKRHFVSKDRRAFIAYAIWRDVAVTLGDPVGPVESCRAAILEFVAFCARQDWIPVFYEVRGDLLDAYRDAGFRSFKVAEDARLDLRSFALAGRKFQNLRTAHNKIAKSGWRVDWHAGSALPPDLHEQMSAVSAEWLKARHAVEMTFDLGSMTAESLDNAEVSVLLDNTDRVLAFASWLPYAKGSGRALDLMRHRPSDRGTVDPLVVASLLKFQADGVNEASLGNAPLANIDGKDLDSLEEKAVRLLYERFDHYYGYRTLFDFKDKFHPVWSGRYLAYRGLGNLLPAVAGVVRVHLPSGLTRFLRS